MGAAADAREEMEVGRKGALADIIAFFRKDVPCTAT